MYICIYIYIYKLWEDAQKLQEVITAQDAEIAELKKRMSALQKQLQETQDSLAAGAGGRADLQKQIQILEKEKSTLQLAVDVAKDQASKDAAAFQAKLADNDALIVQLQQEVGQEKSAQEAAEVAASTQGANVRLIEDELKKMRDHQTMLRAERDRFAKEAAQAAVAKATLETQKAETAAAKSALQEANEDIARLMDEINVLKREQVASLTEERDKLAKEGAVSADLEAELKKLREQLASLTEERDKLTEEAAMLAVTRTELESKTVETEAAKAALKDARDEVERLKKLLADKEAAPKQADKEKMLGLQRAIELATMTMEEVAKEHLADHACVTSATHSSSNTTVGLSFDIKNATVSGVLVGGPAFNSKQVHKDDVIMAVDGQAVQGNQILDMLKGVDKPGSVVTLTLRKTSVSASSFGMLSPPLHSREKC
jgi:chromosome segregation ATPase